MIIEIEGLDGVGKTTIAKALVAMLPGATYVKFPDRSTPTGKCIDDMLQGRDPHDPVVYQALNVVNRLEHTSDIVRCSGNSVNHLVCDRYEQSAYTYGEQDGLDPTWLRLIMARQPVADLHVLLTMEPALVDAERLKGRDRETYEFRGVGGLREQEIAFKAIWDQHRGQSHWVEYETSTFSPAHIAAAIACDLRDLLTEVR